jgi:ABC-2 type transport system ATP-binding protein/lipopolysaccharide transport system ATP-binding protein
LLEVGTGFHPELSGRDNIYLNGSILGMDRRYIARRFDEIVEFAGVREFIDTPVKRYSSGMHARLGFAVAAHLDPEILVIDEVLSVGDAGFQDRCIARMRAMLARGVPLVFVSHNLQAVQALCQRVIVMNRGEKVYEGEPPEAIQAYRKFLMVRAEAGAPRDLGDTTVRIGGVQLLDEDDNPSEWFRTGGRMTVRILYDAPRPIERPQFAVELHRADGVYCYGVNSHMDGRDFGTIEGCGWVDLAFPRLWLNAGFYAVSVGILDTDFVTPYDVHHLAYPFSVASDRKDAGVAYLEHSWRHDGAARAAKRA